MNKYGVERSVDNNNLQFLVRMGGSFSGSQKNKRIHSFANEKRKMSVENYSTI